MKPSTKQTSRKYHATENMNCGEANAYCMRVIDDYWSARGHCVELAAISHSRFSGEDRHAVPGIKSNLVNALPRKKGWKQ